MLDYSTRVLSYDQARYPFAQLVKAHFRRDLALLHEGAGPIPRLMPGMDTQTPMHQHFYRGDETGVFLMALLAVYQDFVRSFVLEGRDASLYLMQRVPTFRVHLPGNVATGNFHRDADFGHSEQELNYIVALTPMDNTQSVWIETERGKGDYAAAALAPGQVLRFHGAVLGHGSIPNATDRTRVSFDFRILPKAGFTAGGRTVNQGVPFTVGPDGYYCEVEA